MEQAWSWPNKGQNLLGLLVRFRWGQFRTRYLIKWCHIAGDKVRRIGKVNMGQRHTQVASQAFVGRAERRHQSVASTLDESERVTPPQCLTAKKHFLLNASLSGLSLGTMTHVQDFIFLTWKKKLSLVQWVWPCKDPQFLPSWKLLPLMAQFPYHWALISLQHSHIALEEHVTEALFQLVTSVSLTMLPHKAIGNLLFPNRVLAPHYLTFSNLVIPNHFSCF